MSLSDGSRPSERTVSAEASAPAGRRARLRLWVRRLAPYVLAILAISAVFSRYSPKDVAAEMARGNWLAVAPPALFVVLINVLCVAAADTLVLRACSGHRSWREVLIGKAGSAVLFSVGYAAAHGGYGLWIARKTGAGVARTGGIILYIVASELAAVSIVATLSIYVAGAEVERALAVAAPSIAALIVLAQIAAPLGLLGHSGIELLAPWSTLTAGAAIAQQAIRVLQIYLLVVFTWLGARAFGLEIPLPVMTAYMPIVLVVGSLPINVAGVGAVQLAWLKLAPWSTGERVLAFSFVWQLLWGTFVVVRGLPFTRRVVTEIDEGRTRVN